MRLNKDKFKILLVSFYNYEAHGLRILHSILVHGGFDCKMCFIKSNWNPVKRDRLNYLTVKEIQLFKKLVNNFEPNLIGFSLVSASFSAYKKVYDYINDYKTIVGGWQASLSPEETIKHCNMLCIGEGEEPILEIANNMYANRALDDIKNIWIRKDKAVIKNNLRPLISEFVYPAPKFEDKYSYFIENGEVVNKDPYKDSNRYGTMIGRGCPYRCSYCSNSRMVKNVYKDWCKIRFRKPRHVIEELIIVKNELINVDRINFYDEVFIPQKEWVIDFLSQYMRLIKLPFYCMFYPGTCPEDIAKMLKEAGLTGVWIGVQSGSERVRKEIFQRYYTNTTILKQAEIFKKYDISVRYDFIFENPFETEEETEETIKLMRELPKPCSFNMFSLKYFPNTDITKMALDKGIITEQDINNQLRDDDHNFFVSKEREATILSLIN